MTPAHEYEQWWFDAEFGMRVMNCLRAANIRTRDQLSRMTDAELLRLENFGRHSLAEVRAVFPDPTICPTCHGSGRVRP